MDIKSPPAKRQRLPTSSRHVWMLCHSADEEKGDEYQLYFVDLDTNTIGNVDEAGYTHIVPTFRFDGDMRPRAFCILGSSLYIFEGCRYTSSDYEHHWGKSVLKFELCPTTRASNQKKFEDCDLEKLGDMPTFKNYPNAIPTPDGKKIIVFSAQIIVSPEIQNLFHLYDPSADSWEELPGLSFPYDRKHHWMLLIDAYSFINDHVFFIQLCSGMFALDLKSPEKGWDFLGDPSHDDPHVPWDGGGYFPTINNKFVFLDGIIFDVIDVGLSREERKSEPAEIVQQLSSFPSTDIELCYPKPILSSVTLVHHDIHDGGVVHWCALKSKYIPFPKDTIFTKDTRCRSHVLVDVLVTDLADLNTSINKSLKLIIDHASSLTSRIKKCWRQHHEQQASNTVSHGQKKTKNKKLYWMFVVHGVCFCLI